MWQFISEVDDSENVQWVRALLARSAPELFQKLDTPEAEREALLDQFSQSIVSLAKGSELDLSAAKGNASRSWAERVGATEDRHSVGSFERVTLPDTAPAIWKHDKLPGENPRILSNVSTDHQQRKIPTRWMC